jgi:hypothetical protein
MLLELLQGDQGNEDLSDDEVEDEDTITVQ